MLFYDKPCFLRTMGGSFTSSNPSRIQTFDRRASDIVSALRADRRSVQICRDFEKVRSTETLVAGIAKKSLAMQAIVGNDAACCCSYHRKSPSTTVE